MHLGNGALTPECALVTLGVAAVGAGSAIFATQVWRQEPVRVRTAAIIVMVVFAAQMFNVPVMTHSSAHLVGGVLLAWVLGPPLGFLCMCGILTIQALTLGDGGLLALGANAINMGLVPAIVVALFNRFRDADLGLRTLSLLGGVAFGSILVGAALIVVEMSVGRTSTDVLGLREFASRLLVAHVAAGLFESVATVAIVVLLAWFSQESRSPTSAVLTTASGRQFEGREFSPAGARGFIAASLLVAVLSSPALGLASPLPDGYVLALSAGTFSDGFVPLNSGAGASAGLAAQVDQWQTALVAEQDSAPLLTTLWTTALAGIFAAGLYGLLTQGWLSSRVFTLRQYEVPR